jgi:ribose 1,5-bisphosphokinase
MARRTSRGVTVEPTIYGHRPATIGPGRFILVVGPSGAGKDTLLGLARSACANNGDIVFARRVVTREASSFEDNLQVSHAAFRQALERDEFVLHWQAHGHCYGLPRAIDEDIRAGRTVVANVSRTVVEATRRVYANVTVISVTAPPEVLAERLATRARSSDGELADRLGRVVATAADVTITNVGRIEDHACKLIEIVSGASQGVAAALRRQ